jgi:hypothetical protein
MPPAAGPPEPVEQVPAPIGPPIVLPPPATPWPAALDPVVEVAGSGRSRSRWLFGAGAVVAVGAVAVAGFVVPGLFVRTVLDQEAVQNGVRQVLHNVYHVSNVSSVDCPADQEVVPGSSFRCIAMINNSRADVTVVIQDREGSYLVVHPS